MAEILASKIRVMRQGEEDEVVCAKMVNIEHWQKSDNMYRGQLDQDIAMLRDDIDAGTVEQPEGFFEFNYVVVGIGQYNQLDPGQNLSAHLHNVYPEDTNIKEQVRGEKESGREFHGMKLWIRLLKKYNTTKISMVTVMVLIR